MNFSSLFPTPDYYLYDPYEDNDEFEEEEQPLDIDQYISSAKENKQET